MTVTTPINVQPPDTGTDVSITPTLIANPFITDAIVAIPGGGTEPTWTVGLSVSQDGIVFGPEIYRSAGLFGNYRQRMQWRGQGGLGRYESFMGIRLRTNMPFEFSADSLMVDFGDT